MNFQDLYQILEEVENEPYPVVEEIKPDYQLGKALYNSYAGMYGELTAITQYIYEHVTNDCDRE